MWGITWTVKASKLCNLRCLYCYEWESLADPYRISIERWATILTAVRQYHEILTERFGEPGRSTINWHGGEPLLLPIDYVEEVLVLEQRILGRSGLRDGTFANFMQTNLYALDDRRLDLLQNQRFGLGVSLDVVPGMRLTRAGHATEERVLANLHRVLEREMPVWGVVILARHTLGGLRNICDSLHELGIPLSLSALSPAPLNTPDAPFAVTDQQIVAALEDLFVHWWEGGAAPVIEPLQGYLQTVLMRMTGLSRFPYDRREHGDRTIVVDTDGSLYPVVDRYVAGRSLGNVFEQTLDEILWSTAYSSSLYRDERRRHFVCRRCEYLGACDTYPAFSTPSPPDQGRCRIAWDLQSYIERHLRRTGIGRTDLLANASSLAVSRFRGEAKIRGNVAT